MRLLTLLLFLPLFLFADVKVSSFAHQDTRNQPKVGSAPYFKGLILVGNKGDLSPGGYEEVHGIMTYHVDLPGNIVNLKRSVRTYYNHPLNGETIAAIKNRVIEYYGNAGRPVVAISVPEQDVTDGVLQLIVTEGKLGKVTCTGNKWFSEKRLLEGIQLEPGQSISANLLDQNLYWLNRNPYRQIDAVYTPGSLDGTTDIELICKDRLPLRVYGGIDNTGNDVTGNNRLFTGIHWGNVFWTDQRLSYQFATSSDFKRFQAHTLYYEIPLPKWQHLLNIYGGYSHVDADFPVPTLQKIRFRTHGFSLQTSLRYDITLRARKNFLHEVTWGFDFKRTNNNLDLGGIPIISKSNVNLTQFQLGYNLGYATPPLSLSFEIEGYYSPGKWISDQTDENYQTLRPYAKNQYVYSRTALSLIYNFYQKWALHTTLRGQIASNNLLPSEEYGLGGYNTVRGYKERIVNGDEVFLMNLELRTPPVSILNALAGWQKFNDSFQFLLFFDYGIAGAKRSIPSQPKTSYLTSIGPGVRYNVIPYLTLRADWGFQLHNLHLGGPYQRLHFSLSVGY
ncbi:MAG: ShlB/FhaC/HecB family hemolysin secretion/activation protein [Chlamydiia bacterium]|nr:ShlB/FhaC/HecB family hemolysin secretion/activation protein [Chlamydiia bacterium]